MKTNAAFFALVTITVSGLPTKRVDFGSDFTSGDGRTFAKAVANVLQRSIDIQRGEQDILTKIPDARPQELAHADFLADAINDLAPIEKIEQPSAAAVQKSEQSFPNVQKRQSLTPTSTPTPGPGLEDSRNNKVPEPYQTGWIFGAIIISMALVIGAILLLRKKRRANLARAEKHELKDTEDAYAA